MKSVGMTAGGISTTGNRLKWVTGNDGQLLAQTIPPIKDQISKFTKQA